MYIHFNLIINGENIKQTYEAFKSNVHKSREVIDDKKVGTFRGGLGHGYKFNMDVVGKPSSKGMMSMVSEITLHD